MIFRSLLVTYFDTLFNQGHLCKQDHATHMVEAVLLELLNFVVRRVQQDFAKRGLLCLLRCHSFLAFAELGRVPKASSIYLGLLMMGQVSLFYHHCRRRMDQWQFCPGLRPG